MPEWKIEPVGFVRCTRIEPTDDDWNAETSWIELIPPFDSRALAGVETFSHVMVLYIADNATWNIGRMQRRPRGNTNWPLVGIFAQRAKDRPNRILVSVCRVVKVDGNVLHVSGLDAIDGSPVVDIKPHMAEFGPQGEVVQPSWSHELMKGYF